MNDAERGIEEWRELQRRVEAALEDPEVDSDRRARLRLTEKPSFANYRQWTVMGPTPRETVATLRRLVWRADLDGPRGDPMWRIGHLDHPLEPTMEAVEASAPAADVEQWLARIPAPTSAGIPKLQPRSISLDGSWYSIELNFAGGGYRYDWYSVELDGTPVDGSYQQSRGLVREASRLVGLEAPGGSDPPGTEAMP